ncbi:MAG: glycosyl transferase [Bacteroidetes bacterium]|nr:glycosyl transferase [Bacteroidota bacterium]
MNPIQTIFFTLCSNNYLGMAKTLGESVKTFHPEASFVIGLVDLMEPEIDYLSFPGDVIPAEDIGIEDWEKMQLNYSIIELNTSVKPYFFRHFFKTRPQAQIVVYLDPDTQVFSPLTSVLPIPGKETGVLTPHTSDPIPLDGLYPDENLVLNHGIYNLGFFSLARSTEADLLIDWWAERMIDRCKIDLKNGMFTDQLYMNLAPLFFGGLRIEKHNGLNVAFWNLHTRTISFSDGIWKSNDVPLLLYHFSGFVMKDESKISKGSTRFSFGNLPDLKLLFDQYRKALLLNSYEKYCSFTPWYVTFRENYLQAQYKAKLKKHPVLLFVHYAKLLVPSRLLGKLTDKLRYSKY